MVLRLADFFMRLEARLSYALIGLVQATGYAGGLDCVIKIFELVTISANCLCTTMYNQIGRVCITPQNADTLPQAFDTLSSQL